MKKKFILIGHPVSHSVSPVIHRAAYQQLKSDAEYDCVDCLTEQAVQAQFRALRNGQLSGANVTVPWKQLAYDLADERDETAQRVGVANVLSINAGGQIVASNTDATALALELRASVNAAQIDTSKRQSALVLGNGGAAKAAVVACQLAGIDDVIVSARRFQASESRQLWASAESFLNLGARLVAWPSAENKELEQALAGAHLIVQATSAGMKGIEGGEELAGAIPWLTLAHSVAFDLVYNPPSTPFLQRAQEAGMLACGGLGMLVGQASCAIEIWLGVKPDSGPLMAAARKALGL